MTAYDPSEWTDFFVASAGASAALAGLVFVAVSINIDRILKMQGVPERALETVLTLLGVVLVSLVMLMPGVGIETLGVLLLLLSLTLIAVAFQINGSTRARARADGEPHVSRHLLRAMATVPVLVGALSLLTETGGGLYWIGAAVLLGTLAAVINAWVLLVEILR